MSPVDLNIIESDKMDLRTICNLYHVPSELFNDAGNKTYSNTKEAGSAVYTNAVIPALTQFRDAFNQFIYKRYQGKVFVDFDTSMISELQDDISVLITAMQGAWYLTPNEKRDMISFGADEKNPMMNEYFVPAGLMPMSAVSEPDMEDVDEAVKRLGIKDY
jgi:phage portal protein BeeE